MSTYCSTGRVPIAAGIDVTIEGGVVGSGVGTETTVPTPLPTTPPSMVTSIPAAIGTLPVEQYVDIQVEKQRPDATIHLLYNGGKGEIFVQSVMMRVARSDGTVEEKFLNDDTRKPQRGDELVMDGTRGVDQVAVFLTSAGITYK